MWQILKGTVSQDFLPFLWVLKIRFKKERLWANRSRRSLQKSAVSKLLSSLFKKVRRGWFACDVLFRLKNRVIRSKNSYFSQCFDSFSLLSPFLCTIANHSCCTVSESLPLLFTKERTAPALFTKDQPWVINCSFPRANLYFAHKKRAICSKNQRANSQPCDYSSL